MPFPDEQFIDLSFPSAGLDVTGSFNRQPSRQVAEGVFARTTPVGTNVRAHEPGTDRRRGGARCGLSRYINAIPGSTAGQIQELAVVVGAGYTPPGGTSQSSLSGRVVTLVAVIGGRVYVADAGGTSWTAATNGSSKTDYLASTGVVRSTVINQVLYLTDGTQMRTYTPSTNSVGDVVASDGRIPSNTAQTIFPTLMTNWRGRLVLSGLSTEPQNLFISKLGTPTNFNYSPSSTTPTQAVAGNLSTFGLIGDVVTGVAPFNDDVLVVFGDSSVWQLKGDPMQGGQPQRFSDGVGCAFGAAWCKDPFGTMYFFSNRCGVYAMAPGKQPIRMSQPIDPLLASINTGTNVIRMAWIDREQSLRIFVTPSSGAAAATHFTWEMRTGAWWKDTFATNAHNPTCLATFDGNSADDRVTLIGSWDGYVRAIDMDATDDDGTAIASEVWIGPVQSDSMDDWMLYDLQADMGESSGNVSFGVHVGRTAEAAISNTAVTTGTWSASRNNLSPIRRSGKAVYVRVSGTPRWAMERLRGRVSGLGRVRQRQAY